MRSRGTDGNHPMQPLSPKQQPWVMVQSPSRQEASVNRSKSVIEQKSNTHNQTVQEEIRQRMMIEQRTSEKMEKLHEAVSQQRQERKVQREKVAGHTGKIVKILQEQEATKSSM